MHNHLPSFKPKCDTKLGWKTSREINVSKRIGEFFVWNEDDPQHVQITQKPSIKKIPLTMWTESMRYDISSQGENTIWHLCSPFVSSRKNKMLFPCMLNCLSSAHSYVTIVSSHSKLENLIFSILKRWFILVTSFLPPLKHNYTISVWLNVNSRMHRVTTKPGTH